MRLDRLSRREALTLAGASAAAISLGSAAPKSSVPPIRYPRPLLPGARVALVAPSSQVSGAEERDKAIEKLAALGFTAIPSPHLMDKEGYLAGKDADRAADIMAAFLDPKVDGIWCLRGGYGAARLLPMLDFEVIRSHAKALIGYSDITALHLGLLSKAGLASFHGPVGSSDFGAYSADHALAALAGKAATIVSPADKPPVSAIREGSVAKVRGRLIGGNLTVFQSLFGTPYMPSLKGAILFFEDIGEDPYRIDRMLTQLRLAGVLHQAKAILLGDFSPREGQSAPPPPQPGDWGMAEVLLDRTQDLGIAVLRDVPFGHISQKITLQQGGVAELSFDPLTLRLVPTTA